MLIATVDLSKDWQVIDAELHALLNDCAMAALNTGEHVKLGT